MRKLHAFLLSIALLSGCAASGPIAGKYIATKTEGRLQLKADSTFTSTDNNGHSIASTTGVWQKMDRNRYSLKSTSHTTVPTLNVSTIENNYPDARKTSVNLSVTGADQSAQYNYEVYVDAKLLMTRTSGDTSSFKLPFKTNAFYLSIVKQVPGSAATPLPLNTDTISFSTNPKHGAKISVTVNDADFSNTPFEAMLVKKDKNGLEIFADKTQSWVKFLKVPDSETVTAWYR
jgi:hypothetical protein